jgi:hypothetical protein
MRRELNMRALPADFAEDRRDPAQLIRVGLRGASRCTMSDGGVTTSIPRTLLLAYITVEVPTPRGRLTALA